MLIQDYINKHLTNVIFEPPFFYNNEYGIRFELGPPNSNVDIDTYYEVVKERILSLFRSIFKEQEYLYIVGVSYEPLEDLDGFVEGGISFCQYFCDHTIDNFLTKETYDDETLEMTGHYKYYALSCLLSEVDYSELLGLLGGYSQSSNYLACRIYFIEPRSELVFHIYDDRGLDIVSPTKDTLVYLYKQFNDWILDYDREEIDKTFLG